MSLRYTMTFDQLNPWGSHGHLYQQAKMEQQWDQETTICHTCNSLHRLSGAKPRVALAFCTLIVKDCKVVHDARCAQLLHNLQTCYMCHLCLMSLRASAHRRIAPVALILLVYSIDMHASC